MSEQSDESSQNVHVLLDMQFLPVLLDMLSICTIVNGDGLSCEEQSAG